MTTPPIKRRLTAQQILLRRACQIKGVAKSLDAAEISGTVRNGEKGGIVMLPTVGRDLGRTLERSPTRTVAKMRRVPAAGTFVVPGERKTAGKLTVCETLKEGRKLKPNEGNRSASGQRSGYTSRGSTKSQNSNSYPSKWPKTVCQEEELTVISNGSLEEISKSAPLSRTPYDHNLNTPLKSGDSSLCPPIKKKARRRTLKSATASGAQTSAKPQRTKTEHRRGSSQSSGARMGSRRVHSGEEVCHVKCPSKSISETLQSNISSKCKSNSGVTFKSNYGGYSDSETEFDTSAENNRHFRCTESYCKKIDKVSRPPAVCVSNALWSLEIPSETEMQEFLSREEHEDHRGERKSRPERGTFKCYNRNHDYATEADTGYGSSKRSPEEEYMSSSRNSEKCRSRDWNETSYGSPREESYHMPRPCDHCRYIRKQSKGHESGLGTGGTRRDPTNYPHQSRFSRPAYTVGACWCSHGAGKYGRGADEIDYELKPSERFDNRNFTEAITQTSKIIMTKRIDESVSRCSPICSCLEENRSPISSSQQEAINSSLNQFTEPQGITNETGLNAQSMETNGSRSLKQEQCNCSVEQKANHSAVKSNSLVFPSDHKQVNCVELVLMSSAQPSLPPCSSCQQKLPSASSPNSHHSNSYNQQNSHHSNSNNQQNSHHSNSYNQQNSHHSNSYNQQNSHHSNSHNQQNSHHSNSYNQQNSHHSNSHPQHNSNECCENRSEQNCPSVTVSLCECNPEKTKLCKRKPRNPRKRNRRASRCRSRSSSARKEVNDCHCDSPNQRRTQSYEDCYTNRFHQKEDQCDVIRILSIIQRTVAGLEEEIKKAKGYESGRSTGNRFEPRREQQITNISNESSLSAPRQHELCPISPPAQPELPCTCSPCQHELSPLSPTCQQDLSSSNPPCQQELCPLSPPGQPELPPLITICHQELPSCSPPLQQESCSSNHQPYQQELSSSNQAYQQELSSSGPPGQQELPPSNSPCHEELPSSSEPCKHGLSRLRPFCQPNPIPACQQGWASSYKQHKCHHRACPYSNAYSQAKNGAVPITYGIPIHPYAPNNPYKYRKALPLTYNWNQTNQQYLKPAYRNNQDRGVARGCTRSEQNYQTNMNGRKTHLFPYTQTNYATEYKNNRSVNQPEGHSIYPYATCFKNNQRTSVPQGNSLTEPRCGKCSLDETQLGNQDTLNRGRVTFQNHVSTSQNDRSFPYANFFGGMEAGQSNEPCQAPENVDNLRNEVGYNNTTTLAHVECHQGSPQAHELNEEQRLIKEMDLEDCENANSSDRCLKNIQGIDMQVCENKTSRDKFPRIRQDIDAAICEDPSCPIRFQRHKKEIYLEDCDNPNCPYRSKRNRKARDLEVCEDTNCPYRFPRNRENNDLEVCDNSKCPYRFPRRDRDDTDSKVCENPNCPHRFQRHKREIDLEDCENPNCPYRRLKRNREDINSEICENPSTQYRFRKTIKEIGLLDVCENPSCPFRLPTNKRDIDLVCENPNCPYRNLRNRTGIDSEVYEYSNTSDGLKRSPKTTILCSSSKLKKKRAFAIPYQISESTLSENPQDRCEKSSSSESCEDPRCRGNKNIKWLSGGFESFDSNSIVSQHYAEYKTEENGFKEDLCHDDFSRCQRLVFTDVTHKTNRQDSGQSDRFDDDSIETKSLCKKWDHRYVPLDKIPINIASGVQPMGFNGNRHNPYLTADPKLNSYEKHVLKNYQKHKIEKSKAREPMKVSRPKKQTRPKNCNCNTIASSIGQHQLYDYDDGCSTSIFSDCGSSIPRRIATCQDKTADCSCSIPRRTTTCQDNPKSSQSTSSVPRCFKRREEIPRSQREQPPDICCKPYISTPEKETRKNYERTTSKSSLFPCYKKEKNPSPKAAENYRKIYNKPEKERRKNVEKSTSKSSLFSFLKKSENPSPKKIGNIPKKERRKNVEKSTSKSSLFSCLKKKEKPPQNIENIPEKERRKNDKKMTSTFSGLSCLKKDEPLTGRRKKKEDGSQYEIIDSKQNNNKKMKSTFSGLSCLKKDELLTGRRKKKEEGSQYEIIDSKKDNKKMKSTFSGLSCLNKDDPLTGRRKKKEEGSQYEIIDSKKKKKSASFQIENSDKKGGKNDEKENDSKIEKIKSKLSGAPCFKKKDKIPPPKSQKEKDFEIENDSQLKKNKSKSSSKEYRIVESENDSQLKKNKSKLSGLPCFKKKEKHPSDQCEYCAQEEYRNVENENEPQCEKTNSKSSGFLSCMKKEKTPSFQSETYCKKEGICVEEENYSQIEKTKSKPRGFPCFKKKEKPEEYCCDKERRKYAENENEIRKEKKPSWLVVFPCCQRKLRNIDKEDNNVYENQERTKKPSKLTECFNSCRKSKIRKEPSNRIEECDECKKMATYPYYNEEVRVLYDSSFRFTQKSCSSFKIPENRYSYNPQEGSTSLCRSENRHRQRECGNGFYKIGQ